MSPPWGFHDGIGHQPTFFVIAAIVFLAGPASSSC
jgi:hypothetical protein